MKSLGKINHPDPHNENCRIIGWRVEIEDGDDASDVLSGALDKLPESPWKQPSGFTGLPCKCAEHVPCGVWFRPSCPICNGTGQPSGSERGSE